MKTSGSFLTKFNSKEEIPAGTYIRTWYTGDLERYGEDTGTEAVGAVRQLVQGQQSPSWLPLIRRCLAILGNAWQYLATLGNTWQYLAILGNT